MPRHLQTTVTFAVKLHLPEGTHTASAQEYIRTAISQWKLQLVGKDGGLHPFSALRAEDFTVRLLKKETLYTTTRKDST